MNNKPTRHLGDCSHGPMSGIQLQLMLGRFRCGTLPLSQLYASHRPSNPSAPPFQ